MVSRGGVRALALAVGALLVLVQSVELANADEGARGVTGRADVLLDETVAASNEQAPLVNMDPPPPPDAAPPTPALSAEHAALVSDVEQVDPTLTLTPAAMTVPQSLAPNEAQAQMTAELSAITDEDGNTVISGSLPDPGNTTFSVDNDAMVYPGGDDDAANAMLSGATAEKGASLPATPPPPTFRNIPYFQFAHDGTTLQGYTKQECNAACSDDEHCMSYSYNEGDQTCIKSTSCVQYDLEFDFYAKKDKQEEGAVAFAHLGALKYLNTGKANTGVTASVGEPEAKCEEKCKGEEGCNSFCYRKRDTLCLTSTQELGYSNGWSYFEKAGAAVKLAASVMKKTVSGDAEDMKTELKQNVSNTVEETNMKKVNGDDANPALSAQIVEKENSEMSKEQLQYLKKNDGSTSPETQAAIMQNALTERAGMLNAEEQARVAVANKVAKAAEAKANANSAAEVKGKKTVRDRDGGNRWKVGRGAGTRQQVWMEVIREQCKESRNRTRVNTERSTGK
jgi:hypothetical protein